MNLETLCDKIELQQEIKTQVLEFVNNFNFQKIDEIQKGYFIYQNMKDVLDKTRNLLGEDLDGIKILSCMLKASLHTYQIYKEKEIPEKIFFDTMKCFTRFINETFKMTGKLSFDRYWWTTRQVGCHLFRIGELEYEIKQNEEDTYISLHIPSDANFSPTEVDKSLSEAKNFFEKFYSELKDAEYTPSEEFPIVILVGKVIKSPQEYTDERGKVTTDYQDYLEKLWVESLRKKYPVEINQAVWESIQQ